MRAADATAETTESPRAGAELCSSAVCEVVAAAILRHTSGVRRRFAPHQLRHAHAVEMAREGVPLIVIQRQLGHSNLGITSVYLQGIDSGEIIETVRARLFESRLSPTRLRRAPATSRAARARAWGER